MPNDQPGDHPQRVTHLHRITLGKLSARSGGVVTVPCLGGDLPGLVLAVGISPWGLSVVALPRHMLSVKPMCGPLS
ncbi:MAG: hypothetical protein HQL80_12880 [Magnetococcales bacterium]|nr:hypothetical protein [Magnetococcales bacterium]